MIQIVGSAVLKEPEFKDGDGDGGEYEYADEVIIKVVTNGYAMAFVYHRAEGDEVLEYVFNDKDDLINQLKVSI